MSFSILQHFDSGCALVNPPELFYALHWFAKGSLCKTGCAYYEDGKCPAYRRMSGGTPNVATVPVVPIYTETVRQEAERLGVTIAEVRRRRRAAIK